MKCCNIILCCSIFLLLATHPPCLAMFFRGAGFAHQSFHHFYPLLCRVYLPPPPPILTSGPLHPNQNDMFFCFFVLAQKLQLACLSPFPLHTFRPDHHIVSLYHPPYPIPNFITIPLPTIIYPLVFDPKFVTHSTTFIFYILLSTCSGVLPHPHPVPHSHHIAQASATTTTTPPTLRCGPVAHSRQKRTIREQVASRVSDPPPFHISTISP